MKSNRKKIKKITEEKPKAQNVSLSSLVRRFAALIDEGLSPAVVMLSFDDNKMWAMSCEGMQPVPPCPDQILVMFEKDDWKPTLKDALEYGLDKIEKQNA